MNEDISMKTGEGLYRRASFSLDRITFNGNEGYFLEQEKDAQRSEATGKFPKKQITKAGEPLEVVFLKIRRTLSSYSKKEKMGTNEHNHKGDFVTLYHPAGNEMGYASDLREKYPQLRTQQVVYCYLPKENRTVRLNIKGASLGSDFKHPKGVHKFYDYFQCFKANEHSHEYITLLKPVAEEGPQGTYYAISFERGAKLDEEQLSTVRKLIEEVHDKITEVDARFQANVPQKKEPGKKVNMDEIPIIEEGQQFPKVDWGEDEEEAETKEIDPKDIPF